MKKLFHFFFMVTLLISDINTNVVVVVHGQCLHDQHSFLLQFKNDLSLDPDFSYKLGMWNSSGSDCCSWEGVTCNFNGHVVALDLSEQYFSGVINDSSTLFSLRHIQHLILAHNDFKGQEMPTKFINFVNLTYLNLAFCNFTGQIPKEISNLTSLVILDLTNSYYRNRRLEILNLMKLVHNLSNLTELYLEGVHISSSKGNDWSLALSSSLPNLRVLNLYDCQLSGTIDSSLKNLQFLSDINLSHNNLSSQIPSSISNLTELVYLDLSWNNFYGQIPSFSHLKNLSGLFLNGNKLNGSISSTTWEELTNLTVLNLSNNSLSGQIPWALFGLSLLYEVDLSHNQLTGSLSDFPEFPSGYLRRLDLSSNQIYGEVPGWIWAMGDLIWLNVSHNSLVEVAKPSPVRIISKLSVVDLHANQIQGQIQSFPSSISYMDYSNNNLSSISSNIFSHLKSTDFLSLSNNNLRGSIPDTICNNFLKVLDLSNNSFSGIVPRCLFENSTRLMALKLSSNKLSGTISSKFARNCSLEYLDLSENLLEGKISRSIANCQRLQFLNLGKNKLNDTFPTHLMKISTLQVLELKSNKLHGSVGCRERNISWSNLHMINIASNEFGGELPEDCFKTWVGMIVHNTENNALAINFGDFDYTLTHGRTYDTTDPYYYETFVTPKGKELELSKIFPRYTLIDFSCNNFEGKIPEVFGEMKELRFLNLSHNGLNGSIPSSVGIMSNLDSLDLSRNNLSGSIPSELAGLNFLSYGDFSYNQLVGQIPTGTQLQSFPNSSYEGNPGLCGAPLSKKCSIQDPITKEPEDNSSGIEWSLLSIEVGLTFGLGVVILPIVFSRRWRIWYYGHVEGVIFKFSPQLDPSIYKSRKRKVTNLQNMRRQ